MDRLAREVIPGVFEGWHVWKGGHPAVREQKKVSMTRPTRELREPRAGMVPPFVSFLRRHGQQATDSSLLTQGIACTRHQVYSGSRDIAQVYAD